MKEIEPQRERMDRMRLSHRTASMARALALMALAAPAPAQDATDEKPKAEKKKEADKPIPPPTVSVTRQKGTFGGQTISYTAKAEIGRASCKGRVCLNG